MSIQDFAEYVIEYHKGKSFGVSPMKLQKILYYLKVWSLVDGHPLFRESFEKWEYGPVNRAIYHHYQKYGRNPIQPEAGKPVSIDHDKKILADFILDCYAPINAISLSMLTHNEAPWKDTVKDAVITDESIMVFYNKQPFAKNFPLDFSNKPFYPVMTDLNYAFLTDMSKPMARKLS
ncbi:MAG: type II toxin-antitoxin system antitoxin SocA domain-containing protein, partial [Candidatus Neomarinimicrobiota bacterium]